MLYAWLTSETLFQDLENLYFLHFPTAKEQSEMLPHIYHELIPGSEQNKASYTQGIQKMSDFLEMQQQILFEITDLLMQDRPLSFEYEAQAEINPRQIYLSFLQYLVIKNIGYLKNVPPPGLTNVASLTSIFFAAVRHMNLIVYAKAFGTFPFQCFFARNSQFSFLSDDFKNVERIGGTVTYLEGELGPARLACFTMVDVSREQTQMATLGKSLALLFTFGVVQQISLFIKACERIYVNSRTFEDLTEKGRQSNGARLVEEMLASAKALPQIQVVLNIRANRAEMHKFALWVTRVINHVDSELPEALYLLPEAFLEIPFEFYRAAFRGGFPLFDAEEERSRFKEEYEAVRTGTESGFSKELIKFTTRHFFDPKIANPDLKDVYLTRLNIIMQKQVYIDLLEQCEVA